MVFVTVNLDADLRPDILGNTYKVVASPRIGEYMIRMSDGTVALVFDHEVTVRDNHKR